MIYKFLISTTDTGNYLVQVPGLPGCTTQAPSAEEAIEQCEAAIEDYLEQQSA